MRLPLAQGKSIQQPAQLTAGDRYRLSIAGWPLERPAFKTAVEEPEAVMLPVQDLELVAVTIAEHEQARGEGIKPESFLHERRQTVNGFSQIGEAACQIDPINLDGVQHKAWSVRTTSDRSTGL